MLCLLKILRVFFIFFSIVEVKIYSRHCCVSRPTTHAQLLNLTFLIKYKKSRQSCNVFLQFNRHQGLQLLTGFQHITYNLSLTTYNSPSFLKLKKHFCSSVTIQGMVLVYKGCYFRFHPQQIMYFISQSSFAHTVYKNHGWKMMQHR